MHQQVLVVRSCIEHVTLLCTATASITRYDPFLQELLLLSDAYQCVQVCPNAARSSQIDLED
jgi:hypothetical protein